MKTISEQITEAMAKAFFASAWADLQEEKEADDETRINLSSCDIMGAMPDDIDPAALHAAKTLTFDLSRANPFWRAAPGKADFDTFLEQLLAHAEKTGADGDRDLTPEMFGHYLAMQAMGHGVGLRDAFGDNVYAAVKVPYVELGSHSLSEDY